MKRTAIVGVGSPQGDDRAGWIVIEVLDAELGAHERAAAGVTTVALDRPGAMLLEHLRNAERAIVVDALRTDEPGAIVLLHADALRRSPTQTSTHGIGVAEALALGAALTLLPRESVVIGIAIDARAAGAGPTARVRQTAALLGRRLANWVRSGGETWPPPLPDIRAVRFSGRP